jgi:DNA-binding NarL/FixJ family response regulator
MTMMRETESLSGRTGSVQDPARIRILLADDHAIVRSGISALLLTQPDLGVVGDVADGLEALDAYQRLKPDIVLLDLQMPKLDGVQTVTRLREVDPGARIIILTTFAGDAQAIRALRAGAAGYLLKTNVRDELFVAIRTVHKGGRYVTADVEYAVSYYRDDQLTAKECDIVRMAGEGRTNKEIAAALFLGERTVASHLTHIYAKLGVRSRTELAGRLGDGAPAQ